MTPLFGFYDDLERYSSTVNSNFVLNIPYTLLREIFIKWETEQKKYILPKEENKMSFGEVSAVEWLVDQMFKQGYFDGNKPLSITNLDHLEQQAKEMEKQQIIDAFKNADKLYFNAEHYYNETYGSNGSDETKTN